MLSRIKHIRSGHVKYVQSKFKPVVAGSLTLQGCQTHRHWGHISLAVAFKGLNVILGLCKWNYSLTRDKELVKKQGAGPD